MESFNAVLAKLGSALHCMITSKQREMLNQSFWEKDTYFKPADFIVIGSGIVGLNTAIELKIQSPKSRVVLAERNTIPLGASTRNAGFACFGSPTELLDDLQHHSEDEVWSLVQQRWEGLQRLREKVGDAAMDYEHYGGYEIFRLSESAIFKSCREKLIYFNQQFERITGVSNTFKVADEQIASLGLANVQHLIWSKLEGQIHPAKMIQQLQQIARSLGVELFFGFEISELLEEEGKVALKTTNDQILTGKRVVVATNGFAKKLLPHVEVEPARNQVLITKPIPNLSIQGCFHYEQGYFYFRNVGNRVLLGGGRHLAKEEEQTDEFGQTSLIKASLEQLLKTVILPNHAVEVEQWWSGILGIGEQKKPIIQMISEKVGVAVRLGGMGVAIGSRVGEQAAKMLLESM